MIVGVLRELKVGEQRVGLIPAFVADLVKQGHKVLVEAGAGVGAGFADDDYAQAGATIVTNADEIWERAKLVVKVKEPLHSEYGKIRGDQILFTYLHLAPDIEQTDALVKSKAVCIAYETVTDETGGLPLLAPMSCIAGRMSVLVAANLLQKHFGGVGNLPCGVPGVLPSKVVILGGGYVGQNAAFIACGIGADVTVLDNRQQALEHISNMFHGSVKTAYSNSDNIAHLLPEADIVIGAALVVGASTPKLVSKNMVCKMRKGSVIVDVSIDQGGCCETSHPTTHDAPYYEVDGVLHYCVANMPGAFARTATISLNNATYPFIEKLANLGCMQALKEDKHLRNGLNVYQGQITNQAVATSQGREFTDPWSLLEHGG